MPITSETGEHPGLTVAPSEAARSALQRPEFFRLPKSKSKDAESEAKSESVVDPYFGFSRSFYYEGEQRGYWKLVRIRKRGKLRGVTLIPYDAVARFVRSQMKEAS
jgi:hypothetical protein